MTLHHRLFSLEEANALLPELDSRMGLIEHARERYAHLHDEILMHELVVRAELEAGMVEDSAGLDSTVHHLEAILQELEREIDAILKLGCFVRSLERGWVDFPAARGSEKIYYCWRRGEASIGFYHTGRDGATERQPLD